MDGEFLSSTAMSPHESLMDGSYLVGDSARSSPRQEKLKNTTLVMAQRRVGGGVQGVMHLGGYRDCYWQCYAG